MNRPAKDIRSFSVLRELAGAIVRTVPASLTLLVSLSLLPFSAHARPYLSSHADEDARAVSLFQFRERVPVHERHAPRIAVQISYAPQGLGSGATAPTLVNALERARSFGLEFSWQPPWIQKYGVISIGPELQFMPITNKGALTAGASGGAPSFTDMFSYGVNIRYQLRLISNQWVVPVFGYEYANLKYNFDGGPKGTVTLSGAIVGAELYLSALDPSGSAQSFTDIGLARTYLVIELRTGTAQDANIQTGNNRIYGALRMEF